MRSVNLAKVNLQDDLRTVDHIVVYEQDGRIIDMRYVRIADKKIIGSLIDNGMQVIEISVANIEKIEVERTDGAKTTGAVIGGILIAPLVIIGGGIGMGKALDGN